MVHNFHKDINITSIGKSKDRNFYMPYKKQDKGSVYKGGSRYISLNGDWLFHYYDKHQKPNKNDVFSIVDVPKNWQYYGTGKTAYVNDYYLIDVNPPFVNDSDYAIYKKNVFIDKSDSKYYINFEGKDSCLYLYVNNSFVGYDSVSHCTSEFDITDYIIQGDNEIKAYVYEYSVGTYLECQDKIRLGGLFRDVYIIKREKEHIISYKITYDEPVGNQVAINFAFETTAALTKTVEIYRENSLIASVSTFDNSVKIIINDFVLWNAEKPFLYDIHIICNQEYIYDYLGIRYARIKDNILFLNDVPIKLLGVNHHDSHFKTGYYLSLPVMKQDILLMKEHNINAIRT